MKNPIGSFDTIKENFVRYVKTIFDIKFDDVAREREDLIHTDKVFYRQPWIEPLPEYKSSEKTIEELDLEGVNHQLDNQELDLFKKLAGKGLVGGYQLYEHQMQMLQKAMSGKHCVITSGTGSGKTESFLLPLFAQLCKEMAHWNDAPQNDNYGWWNNLSNAKCVDKNDNFRLHQNAQQRTSKHRPAAVRALILYPMNALVEDQMTRLRQALDSKQVRAFLQEDAKNNKIYFGRYNSETPIPGMLKSYDEEGNPKRNERKISKLKKELQKLQQTQESVEQYLKDKYVSLKKELAEKRISEKEFRKKEEELKKEAPKIRAFFPQLDGAEMRSRFDMQLSPPDILITNFSMLSVMLMRNFDAPIFEKTRAWLQCRDKESAHFSEAQKKAELKNRKFHLIIDELHLYRGTAGTEVAYLVKLLLHRLGLDPEHEQLSILASSASLEATDENSIKYLGDFFGVDKNQVKEKFKIIKGEQNIVSRVQSRENLPFTPFVGIKENYQEGQLEDELFLNACSESSRILKSAFNIKTDNANPFHRLLEVVLNPKLELRERLFEACQFVENKEVLYRPVPSFRCEEDNVPENLKYFSETLFGVENEPQELRDAVEGLLILRALIEEETVKKEAKINLKERKLPRFRFHYFFRNIEGLWASVSPDDVEKKYASQERPVGRLFPRVQLISQKEEKSYRVLELLHCENCSTLLYGGSRGNTQNSSEGKFQMLSVSPKIEGVPEKTPAKMVEQRAYQEYAVFWTKGEQQFVKHDKEHQIPENYWRQTSLNEEVYSQTSYKANWAQAWLNVYSGDVEVSPHSGSDKNKEDWVKGYLFQVKDEFQVDIWDLSDEQGDSTLTHKALPCVCPCCGVNYQIKNVRFPKRQTSPIRGFRTGFAKSVQLFAKELMYQLPGNQKQKKLVVFSDSREDAANVANGIERNHYADLLREILIDELHTHLLLSAKIYAAIKKEEDIDYFRKNYQEEYEEIEELIEFSEIPDSSNSRKQKRKKDAQNKLDKKLAKTIKVYELLKLIGTEDCAPLIKRFIELGINPGGVNINIQSVIEDDLVIRWDEVFDFEKFTWKKDNRFFQDNIERGLLEQLGRLFFARLLYSFESAGLGYLTLPPDALQVNEFAKELGLPKDIFVQIVSATIRVLGDKYKYSPNDFDFSNTSNFDSYNNLPSKVRKYIEVIAKQKGLEEDELGRRVFEALQSNRLLRNDIGIDVKELYIKLVTDDAPVWTAKNSKRIHLHPSGGICTFSLKPLFQKKETAKSAWEKNYIAYHAAVEKRKPIRLHCEELTGQTDNQFERQRHFRNVVLKNEGNSDVRIIDLLSVTTTLEVGVDIGDLQALMLANMPPQRFNYQQRVGRTGRRGQAYSAILTFCRGRSHDEFYFNNPQKITGDPPPTPFLANKQLRITKRLIAKEILREAFTTLIDDQEAVYSSVHGQFGVAENWDRINMPFKNWLKNNTEFIESIIIALKPNIQPQLLNELKIWAVSDADDGLYHRIDKVVENKDLKSTHDLSQKLAEGGVLPMFGMPTSVKNFYHGIQKQNGRFHLSKIDRNQDLAIFEFAPDAQKTKDKAIHTAIGFTDDLVVEERTNWVGFRNKQAPYPFGLERWMLRCRHCGYVDTFDLGDKPDDKNCPSCVEIITEPENIFQIKSPVAYRSDLSNGKDQKKATDLRLSQPPIFAEREDGSLQKKKEEQNYFATISDNDMVWRLNTNGERFFTGAIQKTVNKFPNPKISDMHFGQQWIPNSTVERINEENRNNRANADNRYGINFYESNIEETNIALVAGKNTEVFRLHPREYDFSLDLNMYQKHPKKSTVGIRSAYFSAAFLLQRVLADDMDIDPMEIEIADIRRLELNNNRVAAEIILTDYLPNGSGFTRKLFENLNPYLHQILGGGKPNSYTGKIHTQSHFDNCKDACYECLKVYRNMNYHSLLDWRLGMSLLRVMSDKNHLVGTDFQFSNFAELQDWKKEAHRLRDNFVRIFGNNRIILPLNDAEIQIPALITPKKDKIILITHPLWKTDISSLKEGNEFTNSILSAQEILGNEKHLYFMDTFNLHRRIGWCYEQLIAQIHGNN